MIRPQYTHLADYVQIWVYLHMFLIVNILVAPGGDLFGVDGNNLVLLQRFPSIPLKDLFLNPIYSMKQTQLKLLPFLLLLLCPFLLLAHGVSQSDQDILSNGGLLAYIFVGAKHMITGYDHLLFLTGVIFYLSGFKDIVRFITVFTIGHSITLISATYLGIKADEHLIDAVIALSVLYKGFENLEGFKHWFNVKSPNLLFMVFLFGLIHGFGLSTRLQSFDLGPGQFLLKIISFNVGVEIGQILALIPIVFIISKWKPWKSYQVFYKSVNWFLVVAGVALFIFQIYGYLNGH